MYHAFPPIAAHNPKVLILGTFPSQISRAKGEYYGNPQNKFWKILFEVFGIEFMNPDYTQKKQLLFNHNLALWDVIASCDIKGALDSNIRNPVYNKALPEFIQSHGILAIAFNGKNAHTIFHRWIKTPETADIREFILPSTSPANARLSYAGKLAAWAAALRSDLTEKSI
ncbi:MAG: DNA-deoxyinosine glycosylase [Spirochaetota bacterium]|nr:DNA-deoxyinosine glycosylase [Spirochaetota bacterium]